jgi:hypothetical protein
VAAYGPFEAAGAHGALLEKGRREAALPEGGERPDGVVAQDHNGFGQVDHAGGSFEGKDAAQGLAADLEGHVG